MTTTSAVTGAELAPVVEPLFSLDEQAALAGSWPATPLLPATPTPWTCGCTPLGACSAGCTCSQLGGLTLSASAATWRPRAGHRRRSPAGCGGQQFQTGLINAADTPWAIRAPTGTSILG